MQHAWPGTRWKNMGATHGRHSTHWLGAVDHGARGVFGGTLAYSGGVMNVSEASELLGVSSRMVYQLAAPTGPIPCYRIGKRIIFDLPDVQEYKRSCLSTETKNVVRSSLSSTALSPRSESALLSTFQKLGIKPKLTHTTAKNQPDSTPSQPESSGQRGDMGAVATTSNLANKPPGQSESAPATASLLRLAAG